MGKSTKPSRREEYRALMVRRQAAAEEMGELWPDPWATVPALFQDARLGDFPVEHQLLDWPERYFAALWDLEGRAPNVVLSGPANRGKTYTAFAMLRSLSEAKLKWAWTTPAKFFALHRTTFGSSADARAQVAIANLRAAPVLLIDDFAAPSTDWQLDQLEQVMIERHENELPTLSTTNLDYDSLLATYGVRLVRRLADEDRGDLVVER